MTILLSKGLNNRNFSLKIVIYCQTLFVGRLVTPGACKRIADLAEVYDWEPVEDYEEIVNSPWERGTGLC